jgi:hypothetical protein
VGVWLRGAHFHLLDLLTERGTVTGTVLSGNADLLCAYIKSICVQREGWNRRTLCHFGGVVGD